MTSELLHREEFLASTTEQHAVERELQIVIEACLDIGHHVISREGLRRPGDLDEKSSCAVRRRIDNQPDVSSRRFCKGGVPWQWKVS